MSELSDLALRQGREMYELGKKHGTIETLMNLKADKINLDNLKAKDFTANIDFSNVKVEMIGGLPTFSYNTKSKVQYCDCCGVELTEDTNKCGYCICDKCNERLEREHKGE